MLNRVESLGIKTRSPTPQQMTKGKQMQYSFRFNEISMNKVWFEAKDDEEAKSLMKQLMEDEININDLPEVGERNRGIDLDFSVSILEDAFFRVVEVE